MTKAYDTHEGSAELDIPASEFEEAWARLNQGLTRLEEHIETLSQRLYPVLSRPGRRNRKPWGPARPAPSSWTTPTTPPTG